MSLQLPGFQKGIYQPFIALNFICVEQDIWFTIPPSY